MTKRTCDVPECERKHYARGWCTLHYSRWFHHGSTDRPQRKRPVAPPCTADNCEKPAADRGLCPTHWHHWKVHGTTEIPVQPLGSNANTVDPSPKRPARAKVSVPLQRNPASCRSEGCGKKPVAKGLCSWHYQLTRDARQPACSVDGCEAPERAKGLCANHYAYKRRHGVLTPQFTCEGCHGQFPGRPNTRHCVACKPTPNFYAQERKARLAINNASMTEADREESAAYQEIIRVDPCVYCGAASVAIDHIAPIVEGGSDRWENLAPVCKSCNSRKRSRSVLVMLLSRLAS